MPGGCNGLINLLQKLRVRDEPSFHNLDKPQILNKKDIHLKRSGIENKILGN